MAPQRPLSVRRVPLAGPLDLRRTLRPLTFVWGSFADDGWWRSARTPGGPATLHVAVDGAEIVGEAWGEGAEWMLDRLGAWVGVDDDVSGFAPAHPRIDRLWRDHRGVRLGRSGLVVEAAIAAVLAQKVTGAEAHTGLVALTRRFSEPAPGPRAGLRLPPDPARLAAAPYYELHDLGIEKRRADIVRTVALRAGRLERLAEGSAAELRTFLELLPGVGAWTSAKTATVSHGDPDAVAVGDFHLRHLVSWQLAGEERGTDERMLELLEPFRPHRGRVVRLLELAGDYPRRGPRFAPRSFAGY